MEDLLRRVTAPSLRDGVQLIDLGWHALVCSQANRNFFLSSSVFVCRVFFCLRVCGCVLLVLGLCSYFHLNFAVFVVVFDLLFVFVSMPATYE